MLRIEVVNDQPDQLGEGPLWDVTEQRLYWIDSYGPAIHFPDAAARRVWTSSSIASSGCWRPHAWREPVRA